MREEKSKKKYSKPTLRKTKNEAKKPYKDTSKNPHNDKNKKDKRINNSPCPFFGRCGGCQFLDIPYADEIDIKSRRIKRLLGSDMKVEPILKSSMPEHYRHKVTGVIGHSKGRVVAGVYEKNSHRLLECSACYLENEKASLIIADTAKLLGDFKIKAYDENNGYGLVRYLQVRVSHCDGQEHYMLTIVTRSPIFPSKNNFVKALRKIHPEIETVVQNVNDRTDSMILSTKENVLYGKGYIEDELLGCRFRISSQSFYQVNGSQTEKLYQTAIDMLKLTGNEKVLDAYCGTGTMGLIAAGKAKQVIGVEINDRAIADARINAKINGIKNIRFVCDDAGEYLQNGFDDDFDAVIMDPPRNGSSKEFIDALLEVGPAKIVYVSCGPQSLKRDLDILKKGYQIKKILPVDMFSRTEHVETVVLLNRQMSTTSIEIEMTAEDLELTRVESKATYKDIEMYVKNKYGLHVSNLYIAQVKQAHGIIERENYNRGSEGHRVPQCPSEKWDAIEDALKYFKMI